MTATTTRFPPLRVTEMPPMTSERRAAAREALRNEGLGMLLVALEVPEMQDAPTDGDGGHPAFHGWDQLADDVFDEIADQVIDLFVDRVQRRLPFEWEPDHLRWGGKER